MKLKVLIGVLVFLIVVNLATLGSYLYYRMTPQPDFPPEFVPGVPGGAQERFHRPPWLTPEKAQQMRQLLNQLRSETEPLQQDLNRTEEALFELLQRESAPDSIERKLEEVAHLRLEISRRALGKLIEAKQFLSPEEQRVFFQFIIQSRPGLKGRRPGFPGREGHRPDTMQETPHAPPHR